MINRRTCYPRNFPVAPRNNWREQFPIYPPSPVSFQRLRYTSRLSRSHRTNLKATLSDLFPFSSLVSLLTKSRVKPKRRSKARKEEEAREVSADRSEKSQDRCLLISASVDFVVKSEGFPPILILFYLIFLFHLMSLSNFWVPCFRSSFSEAYLTKIEQILVFLG